MKHFKIFIFLIGLLSLNQLAGAITNECVITGIAGQYDFSVGYGDTYRIELDLSQYPSVESYTITMNSRGYSYAIYVKADWVGSAWTVPNLNTGDSYTVDNDISSNDHLEVVGSCSITISWNGTSNLMQEPTLIFNNIENNDLYIYDGANKNMGDVDSQTSDYSKASLLIQNESGKLGLSTNKISSDTDLGISSSDNLYLASDKVVIGDGDYSSNSKMYLFGNYSGSYGYSLKSYNKSTYGEANSSLGYLASYGSKRYATASSGGLILNNSYASTLTAYSAAGMFNTVLENYVGSTGGSNINYVGGVLGNLSSSSTINSVSGNTIISAVMGLDQIKSGQTYAGYFDGVSYFSDKLGIGTNPNYKLDILSVDYNGMRLKRSGTGGGIAMNLVNATDQGNWFVGVGSNNYFGIYKNGAVFGDQFLIKEDGNVGIGTTNPNAKLDVVGSAIISDSLTVGGTIQAKEVEIKLAEIDQLDVNGNIFADQIKVKTNGNTADFVFSDNYSLKDLNLLEAYIKANKHLPEIPSAQEMEAEGVDLATMNKLLLQKIEELTLYTIKQEKEKESLNSRVQAMEEELAVIKALISK